MTSIHPFFVHFPLALLTVSFLFDAAGAILHKEDLRKAGWWTMLSGYMGMLVALGSGLLAADGLDLGNGAAMVLTDHKQLAFVAAVCFTILTFWRVASKASVPQRYGWAFWGLYGLGIVVIWYVSWLGGTLVYVHHVGSV